MNIKSLVKSIAIPLAAGGLSALVSMSAMEGFALLSKPHLSPPGWLFPVVWTILYVLMGIASYFVTQSDAEDAPVKKAVSVYALQLVFNFFWSIIFFNLEAYLLAFFWLLALLVLVNYNTVVFWQIDKRSGYLMIPYVLWCMFALYLNLGIYLLN